MASASLVKHRRALAKLWLKWRLAIIGTAVLVVVIVGANLAWREIAAGQDRERQEQMNAAAAVIAQGVSKALRDTGARLAAVVERAGLPALLEAGDEGAIAAAEAQLLAEDDALLRVRVLPSGVSRTDYETTPPLSYASLDLLRRSERSDTQLPPEIHLFGDDGEHVAIASRLADDGGEVIGHALLAVDLDVLRKALAGIELSTGYAELQQPATRGAPLVAAKEGEPAHKDGAASLVIPVQGTPWRVAYWPERPASFQDGSIPIPVIGIGALVVLVLGGAAVAMKRKRGTEAVEGEGAAPATEEALSAKLAMLKDGSPPDADAGEEEAGIEVVEEGAGPAADAPAAPAAAESVGELPAVIFRAYDVRGVVGETLTPEIVRAIGRAVGSEAYDRGQQTLVVARDGRQSGEELLAALVEGLRASGRDVIDVGRVPTPVLYYATHYLNTGSGVMVTGSHNPPEYNGLKIMIGGDTLFGDDIQALRRRIENEDFSEGDGSLQSMEIIVDEYIRRVTEDVPVALGSSYKVVVDCGNGVAGLVAPKLIRALGHDVVELHCEVDGTFPNHHPDPSQPENLADLIQAVADHEADIGFAFDGDGDRLGVVDARGDIVWPDRQLMLFAHDVLKRNKGAEVVFDVKCSVLLGKVIAQSGGKPVMVKTGHSFIKNELKERDAPLAGELSGHIFFKERWYGFDDALYAAARMLEIFLNVKRAPGEVLAKLPKGFSTHELRIDLEEGQQTEFMESLLAEDRFDDGESITIDGLRVDFDDGWGLIRASNTTPSLVLRFEGTSAEALERIQERFREVLLAVRPDLPLPF